MHVHYYLLCLSPLCLSLSLSMARGMLLPAGLMALIVILVLVHQTCSAEGSHHCAPSSCGTIHNISYPFRLEGDPKHCGDPRYTLSCENDQTVLNLYAGKYYVRAINYNNYTIRVVDPGFLNSFIPRYSLDSANFSSYGGDPYQLNSYSREVFVNCEKPLNSGRNVDISSCFKNGVYSSNSSLSHSKSYRYVLLDAEWDFLEDLCQVEQISPSPPRYVDDLRNDSCTDTHNKFSFGFELLWYQVYCGKRCQNGYCYLDREANNVTCDQKGSLKNACLKKYI
jgi:hypothetical protein